MSSKRLIIRILLVLGTAATFLAFLALAAGEAQATPITPDVRKLLADPQPPPMPYEPARAGWNGAEVQPAPAAVPVGFTSTAQVQAVRRALAVVLLPDPRVLGVIVLSILLLRKLRRQRERAADYGASGDGSRFELPQAA